MLPVTIVLPVSRRGVEIIDITCLQDGKSVDKYGYCDQYYPMYYEEKI